MLMIGVCAQVVSVPHRLLVMNPINLQFATQMADLIERFVDGRVGPYEWDDLVGSRFDDPFVERMRLAALTVPRRSHRSETNTVATRVPNDYWKLPASLEG